MFATKGEKSDTPQSGTTPHSSDLRLVFSCKACPSFVFVHSQTPSIFFVAGGQGPERFHPSRSANWLSQLGHWHVTHLMYKHKQGMRKRNQTAVFDLKCHSSYTNRSAKGKLTGADNGQIHKSHVKSLWMCPNQQENSGYELKFKVNCNFLLYFPLKATRKKSLLSRGSQRNTQTTQRTAESRSSRDVSNLVSPVSCH